LSVYTLRGDSRGDVVGDSSRRISLVTSHEHHLSLKAPHVLDQSIAQCLDVAPGRRASVCLAGGGIPGGRRQNSSRDSHCGRARGDIGDNQTVRSNHRPITDGHRANDGTVATNEDVIAYGRSPWSRPCANGAYVVDRTIGSDLGARMHSNEADVRNEEAWADFSVGMNVYVRYRRK
jgi:hypothetical protein